jgi:hypothetical protein
MSELTRQAWLLVRGTFPAIYSFSILPHMNELTRQAWLMVRGTFRAYIASAFLQHHP